MVQAFYNLSLNDRSESRKTSQTRSQTRLRMSVGSGHGILGDGIVCATSLLGHFERI